MIQRTKAAAAACIRLAEREMPLQYQNSYVGRSLLSMKEQSVVMHEVAKRRQQHPTTLDISVRLQLHRVADVGLEVTRLMAVAKLRERL